MDPKAQVGKNLLELRRASKLSREKLAQKTGISAAAIRNIEEGKRWPRPENAQELARAFGLTWEQFLMHHMRPQATVDDALKVLSDYVTKTKLTPLLD